jgi:PAS domain S-box-containing protein/excisionase family DNA binding protein
MEPVDRFSPRNVADALGVGESTVKRWIDAGRMEADRTIGGHRRVALDEVLRFVRAEEMDVVHPETLGLDGLDGAARLVGTTGALPVLDMLHAIGEALEAIAEGVTVSDATRSDNPLVFANAGFYRMTGYTPEEVVGRNCRFLQGPGTDFGAVQQIKAALREGDRCVVELLNFRKDGRPFWNRLSIVPVFGPDGTPTHFVGIQSDVTALRQAEGVAFPPEVEPAMTDADA